MKICDIINIGDEILIGQIINTNAVWMAEQLNMIGVKVRQMTTVSDDKEHITKALQDSETNADIILISGGLGPTSDDITKPVLCQYFDARLVENPEVLADLYEFLRKKSMTVMNEANKGQAMVPENCIVLRNKVGTAPGMMWKRNGKMFVSMPGVPYEMKYLMETYVLPELKNNSDNQQIILHKNILTTGVPESILANKIEPWEKALPATIKLAYLPSPGFVRLRLSVYGADEKQVTQMVDNQVKLLNTYIGDNIVGYDDETPAFVVGKLLKMKGLTISTAESCTGGNIAAMITSVAGCSEYFKGSVVAYSNQVKMNQLQVSESILSKHGAVSEETVVAMAKGVCDLINTNCAISVSGVAGPDGGSEEKPVGTVWIAVKCNEKVVTKKFSFADNRERNITRATFAALEMMRRLLLDIPIINS